MKKLLISTIAGLTLMAGAAQAELANGEYKIGIWRVGGICMDVQGGSTENGANIQMYNCNATDAQTFSITKNSDGQTYSIKGKASNKLFDVENYGYGTNVQQYGEDVQDYRSWIITQSSQPASHYTIRLKSNPDVCMGAESVSGGNVFVSDGYCTGFYFMQPVAQEVLSGSFKIVNYQGDKCLSVWNDVNGDGALVYNCSVNYGQKNVWNVAHIGNGVYEIRNTAGWKLLDKDLYSSKVQVWEGNPSNSNQQWRIEKEYATSDLYRIKPLSNVDECLVLDNYFAEENDPAKTADCNGGSNYWRFQQQ